MGMVLHGLLFSASFASYSLSYWLLFYAKCVFMTFCPSFSVCPSFLGQFWSVCFSGWCSLELGFGPQRPENFRAIGFQTPALPLIVHPIFEQKRCLFTLRSKKNSGVPQLRILPKVLLRNSVFAATVRFSRTYCFSLFFTFLLGFLSVLADTFSPFLLFSGLCLRAGVCGVCLIVCVCAPLGLCLCVGVCVCVLCLLDVRACAPLWPVFVCGCVYVVLPPRCCVRAPLRPVFVCSRELWCAFSLCVECAGSLLAAFAVGRLFLPRRACCLFF